MDKEIKDFIHLYLGCDVKDDYDNDFKILNSVNYDEQKCYLIRSGHVTQHKRDFNEIKIVLRPLTDMNEQELLKSSLYDYKPPFIPSLAESIKYLLSKHFDIFNLIEAGLAIDATTLKK